MLNGGWKLICISEISSLITKRRDCQLQNSEKNQFVTNSNFHQIKTPKKTKSVIDHRYTEQTRREVFLWFVYIIKYFPSYIYIFFLLGVQTALSTKVIRYGIAFVNCFVRCMYVLPKYTRNAVSLEVLKIKFNVWLRSGLASISAQVDFKQQL